MHGSRGCHLKTVGAVLFIVAGVNTTVDMFLLPSSGLRIGALLLWIVGFLILVYDAISVGRAIQKVYPGSLLKIALRFPGSIYNLFGISILAFYIIPICLLDVLYPKSSAFSWNSVLIYALWTFCLAGLVLSVKTRTHSLSIVPYEEKQEEVVLLRDDVLVARAYSSLINRFLENAKLALQIIRESVSEYLEHNPIFFQDCMLKQDVTIDFEPAMRNIDRIKGENRIQQICLVFSALSSRILMLYCATTSPEHGKIVLAESFRATREAYGHSPLFFEVLRSLPEGVMEEEKVALLSKEELEMRVRERTQELEQAKDYQAQLLESLRGAEANLRRVITKNVDCIIIVDKNGMVRFVNPAAEALFGRKAEEWLGKPFTFPMKPDEVMEFKITREDGETVVAEMHAVEIEWEDETANLASIRDITQRKILKEKLHRAERMEAIGTLAGGIAHDFNNLLVGFLSNITLAKRSAEEGEKDKTLRRLQEAENAASLAKDLTQRLLTFAKGGKPITKSISIAELISETATFALSGSNVRCDFAIPDDLWAVKVDRGQMSQVIQNLVLNADEAMPDGGVIKVTARNINVTKRSTLPLSKGNYVEIIIEDKGVGIPKKHLDRIFDPYFSTKQKGSGLGLTTAYSIIKNHGGYITVDSKLGVGTTFSIYLRATKERIPKRKQEVKQPPSLGIKRILVMDDSEIVRRSLSDSIQDIGYEAEFAHEGSEAVELYSQAKDSGQPFDAVLLDLTVPGGMGGKETIERLLKIDPNVKAIVTSGYSTDPVMANYKMYGFSDVLVKPYGIDELEKLLFQILTETKK